MPKGRKPYQQYFTPAIPLNCQTGLWCNTTFVSKQNGVKRTMTDIKAYFQQNKLIYVSPMINKINFDEQTVYSEDSKKTKKHFT